jgi:hypothetical protein
VLLERRGVEVKERVHHGWGMGEATRGSEGLRNLTKEPLGSGSGSKRRFDSCQQRISEQLLQGPVDWHVKYAILEIWIAGEYSKLELRVM